MKERHLHVSILLHRKEAGTPGYSEDGRQNERVGFRPAELGVSLGPVLRPGVSGLGDVYLEMGGGGGWRGGGKARSQDGLCAGREASTVAPGSQMKNCS